MQVSFFEEYPNKKNLSKVSLITSPTKLVVAAPSLKKFLELKKKLKRKVKEVIYWPVLSKEKGYWFSALADYDAMKKSLDEIKSYGGKLSVMIDAEIPGVKSFSGFFKKKRLLDRKSVV